MKTIGKLLLLACLVFFAASAANAQVSVGISVRIAPPALPVYVQPACPVEGYLWQPGYWAYDDTDGYYWVPGVWIAPPNPGLLWTPAYWGFEGGFYGFHGGYWGPHVGFYGGINYGFGYGGVGFYGGGWEGGRFRYNTAVVNVNTTIIHNTYVDRTVINNVTVNNHTSFNGPGGVEAKPRPEELAAQREQHVQPTAEQQMHQQHASQDKSQFAKVNGGHPTAAVMDKVGGRPMNEHGQVATSSKLGNPNANRNVPNRANVNNPNRPNANVNRPANQPNVAKPQGNVTAAQQQRVQQQRMQQQKAQQQRVQQQRLRQQPKPQPEKREQ
jgi:hypothetical protein